jgi:uncharacterized protein (TIGR02231 family)
MGKPTTCLDHDRIEPPGPGAQIYSSGLTPFIRLARFILERPENLSEQIELKEKQTMRKKTLLALSVALAFGSAAHAESNYPITDVTLYPGSATIGRVIHVSPGMTQLEIKDLPANFNTETIRVEADASIHVGQVVTKTDEKTEAVNAHEAELNKKIRALQDKEAQLDAEAKSAQLVQHYLETLNNGGAAEHPVAVDGKTMAAMIDSIHHGASDAFDHIVKVAAQKRDIDEQISALQNDLNQSDTKIKATRTINIALNVHEAGSLRLTYQINGAGWKPGYRASLDSTASKVDLQRTASISQRTGEDWNNVTMTLATGQPNLSPQAPVPNTWQLSYYKPEPITYRKLAAAAPAPVSAAAYGSAQRVEVTGSDIRDPEITELQNTFATQFNVPTRVNLPTDGREIAVNLSTQALPVKQAIRIVPKMDASGVLTASADRPDGVWLAGHVQLFRDGNYVGVTQWQANEAGPLVFPFGRDDLIHVKVDHVQQLSGSSGLLSQHNDRHVADQYIISNAHKIPMDVLVLESSPVSTSDEIHVQPAFLPAPTINNWDDKQGVVGWQKTLAANEQFKVKVDYDISYPKEGQVNGLP